MAIGEYIGKTLLKIFRSSSERYVKKRQEFVAAVNGLEQTFSQLSDEELHNKTEELRRRIEEMEDKIIGENLREKIRQIQLQPEEARKPAKKELIEQLEQCCEAVLAEAFAVVREASDRHLGVRNVFDRQFDFDPSNLSPPMREVYQQVSERLAQSENVHQIKLPPEFYAEVRAKYDAADRPPFRFRHFDVQLIGGAVLYEGSIAEMATGEGKTLVATLAAYMVALSGRKVHIITVNDYLAKRDRDWMGPVYEALGLTVGAIQSDMDTMGDERKEQYACDITHGTNNEFGFDYLRDNMKVRYEDQVQGPLHYVIIDEVDSILIDEARTPLIISGPAFDDSARYKQADKIAKELIGLQKSYAGLEKQIDQTKRLIANAQGEISEAKKAKDSQRADKAEKQLEQSVGKLGQLEEQLARTKQYYEVEYDRHSVHLTHEGIGAAQDIAGIGSFYVGSNMEWPHLLEQALRAYIVFEREKDYVVQDGQVIIVDEFTGRLMHGRQWSDGLHQAIEAKENVTVKEETQTLATITIQNFFKLYQQLAGMTGTAMTEADEFTKIYQLNVVAIPTNKPVVREDFDDLIYKTMQEKFDAIVDNVHEISKSGRPVLMGTISIEKSEALSEALTHRYGLEHEVLNAKQHAREAAIVAKAGHQHQRRDGTYWGNVTIATNMAGRGTDIKLIPEVLWDVECRPQPQKKGEYTYTLTQRSSRRRVEINSDDPSAYVWGLQPDIKVAGGLHVLGTERHEARRIDNQLRGRSGRQGDPGSSQFFLSFDDDLMRIFAGEWTVKALGWIGWQEGEPIYHSRISKGVEKAQKKVEQRNFEARKSLLEYDEVMDFQRQIFYTRRQSILEGRGMEGLIWEMIDEVINETCDKMINENYPYECVAEWARTVMGVDIELDRIRGLEANELEELLRSHARNNAEQEITITLGEYMAEDIDPKEWDLKGLSKWAMSNFGVNVSQNQLRRMTFDEVQEQLIEAAGARIDKYDCSGLTGFLGEDFARRNLCEWLNQKMDLHLGAADVAGKSTGEIKEYLLQRARDAYRRREIEYPVDYILNYSLRREQAGSSYAAKEVADWAKRKYQANLSVEEVQHLSFDKVHRRLLEMSEAYNDGELQRQVEAAVSQCRWDETSKEQLRNWAKERFELDIRLEGLNPESAQEILFEGGRQFLRSELTELERYVLLQIYDATWKDHLYAMDHLKGSIGLRGFAERDPKLEYKREGYRMFQEMLSTIRDKVTDIIFKVRLDQQAQARSVWNISSVRHAEYDRFAEQQEAAQAPQGEAVVKTIKLDKPKVGRNDPCPCGSGKKYKKCCGRGT